MRLPVLNEPERAKALSSEGQAQKSPQGHPSATSGLS